MSIFSKVTNFFIVMITILQNKVKHLVNTLQKLRKINVKEFGGRDGLNLEKIQFKTQDFKN